MSQWKTITLLLFFVTAFAKKLPSGSPNLDYIYNTLFNLEWDDDEASCRYKIFNLLENVKNSTLWATWVWNSIDQSPTGIFYGARYHLGNYDQCLRPPWLGTHPELRTQYCLAEIEMNKDGVKTMDLVSDPYVRAEDYYVNTKTIIGRSFSYTAHGVCLPAECPNKSVEKFVKALMSTVHLRAANDADVSIHHCEQAGAPHKYSNGFYIFIYTFAALVFIAVGSTYYVNQYSISSIFFVNHIVQSFCIRRNWDSIAKENNSDIPCVDGIRFLSAAIIPVLHLFGFLITTSVSNSLDVELMCLQHLKAYIIMHSDVLTDSFLAMSGLLLGRSLATINIKTPYGLVKKILLRYVRLIGVVAVVVFYTTHISIQTDDGPLYPKLTLVEQQACEKNWWLTLLMIGNYVNTVEMCLPGTWYVACDFQLYCMTLLLLFVYHKSPRVGKEAAAIVLVCGFLAPAITVYLHNLPGLVFYDFGLDGNVRKNKFFNYLYMRTHNRIGPYVVGLAVGYLMSKYKPQEHKKIWSKKTSVLGVCASLSLMLGVLIAGVWMFRYKVHGSLSALFATFDRTAFGIGVLGVIIFCTYGDVPVINSFLSWSAFTPFCRLSYGVYLIHQLMIYRSKSSLRSHAYLQLFDIFTESLGLISVSLMLSLVVWLLVEAPLNNITTPFFRTSTTSSGNGVHRDERNEQKLK